MKTTAFRLTAILLTVLASLTLTTSAFALDARGEEERFVVAANETIDDDLYVGATTVIIDGTINGDLIVGATSIEINGRVNGDLMGGGQNVIINGVIADDVRVGANGILVNGQIDGDLLAAAAAIQLTTDASVGGDVVAGAASIVLDGRVDGDVLAGAQGIRLNGPIGGDARLAVGTDADAPPFSPTTFNPQLPQMDTTGTGLMVDDGASIAGDLRYEAMQELNIPGTIAGGDVEFVQEMTDGESTTAVERFGRQLWRGAQRWVMTVLAGWLLLSVAGPWLSRTRETIDRSLGAAAGWGVVWYLGAGLIFAFGLAFVIGIAVTLGIIRLGALATTFAGLGLLGLGTSFSIYILILLFVTRIITGLWLGSKIVTQSERPIVPLALGTFIIYLLTVIPYVGWLLNFVIMAIGLGAIWVTWRNPPAPAEKSPKEIAVPA